MSCWKDKYDMVISIRSTVCRDRIPSLERELARVGIEPDLVIYSVPSPFEFNAASSPGVRSVWRMSDRSRPGFLNSGLAHYRAWKTARGLGGAERALIVEDDVRFLKDVDRLHEIVRAAPDSFDVHLYDLLRAGQDDPSAIRAALDAQKVNPSWTRPTERPCSFACYGVTRAAMDHLSGCVDGAYAGRWKLHIVDHYIHRRWLGEPPRISIACAWPLGCIQRPFRSSPSNTVTVFNGGRLDAQLDWYANGLGLDLNDYASA